MSARLLPCCSEARKGSVALHCMSCIMYSSRTDNPHPDASRPLCSRLASTADVTVAHWLIRRSAAFCSELQMPKESSPWLRTHVTVQVKVTMPLGRKL